MKKKFIILLCVTVVILLYDAADLILNLVFNIREESIDITSHGLVCILMCAYAVFFVHRTYELNRKNQKTLK